MFAAYPIMWWKTKYRANRGSKKSLTAQGLKAMAMRYGLQTYRMIVGYDGTWKGATGANPWDYNVTEPDGIHIDGHPPYLFESGTVSSAVNNPNGTMTDSMKNWITNQWNGYALRRPSDGATWRIAG